VASSSDNESGFTMIEVLSVVIIIGILSAIALPWYLNMRNKALYAEAETIARGFVPTLLAYQAKTGSFPPDVNNDEPPIGLEAVWIFREDMPLKSPLDFDNQNLGNGFCVAQFTFFGANGSRNTNPISLEASGDDLIIPIGMYRCEGAAGSVR